jgi:glutathione-regulated potassium-efflux system ancillary protein KefG
LSGTNTGILLVLAHPAFERARANAAMLDAARTLDGVAIDDLYELYPDFAIDVRREQELLATHGLIVLQFPLYWYSAPALLKEWLDLVWLHGFAYGETAGALRGKTLLCAVSTGAQAQSYDRSGLHRYTIAEFLRPFEQTARLCDMRWAEPFVLHGAALLDDAALRGEALRYAARLRDLSSSCQDGSR